MTENDVRASYHHLLAQLLETVPDEQASTFVEIDAGERTGPGKTRIEKARNYVERLALAPSPGSIGSFILDGSVLPMNEASRRDGLYDTSC